jgi:hypothetical protein
MLIGEIDLETMANGSLTQEESVGVTTHQRGFSRDEEAKALQIGRLLDGVSHRIGCPLLGRGNGRRAAV